MEERHRPIALPAVDGARTMARGLALALALTLASALVLSGTTELEER